MDRTTDKRKQSFYMTDQALDEIGMEAARLDRSMSWVMQQAWKIARDQVRKLPSSTPPR